MTTPHVPDGIIEVSTQLRMEQPPDVVRAQYWDIDHHIRNNVHPGIRYSWEESKPGARKIRTEFRLLGIKQFDISLLVEGPDGAFVIDYLEGANAGTKLIHEFLPVPDAAGATLVRITARVPASLHRKLLGPLFKLGVRQVIDKALREDKADLEKKTFDAGRLAGNVAAVLELLSPVKARVKALGELADGRGAGEAILEAAALVAAADGEVDSAERDALRRVTRGLDVKGLDEAWADAALERAAKQAQSVELAELGSALGKRWKDLRLASDALVPAAIVAQASFGVALAELGLLRCITSGAGIDDAEIERALDAAKAALSTRVASA